MSKIHSLIEDFSTTNLIAFLRASIPSFKPNQEELDHLFPEDIYDKYESIVKIGEAEIDKEDLIVIASKTNEPLTERTGKKNQYNIAKTILKHEVKDAAIFVFYDGKGNFRFSFVRANYLGHKRDFSNYKRYTYFVSPNQTNKTFIEQVGKCNFKSIDEIVNAFSVEKLTQDFYKKLFAWYEWTLSDEVNVTFPNNTKTSEDDRYQLEEQIIRLITRLLFVWFIKQKKIVPDYLFDVEYLAKILKTFDANSKDESNYYNAILQNLFFATLNKEIEEREFAALKSRDIKTRYRYEDMFSISETEIINLFKNIPFLNGGLFECLDKEDMDGNKFFLDGFSRNPTKAANGNFKHRAFIPNCVFFDKDKGIIPLLKSYNFTVDENAPNEIQVALDPELLGKVFENLLGAFNPETKDTARKQSGSFYTPREIVDYMVNESLTCYLQTHFPAVPENQLQSVFQKEELPIELSQNHQLREELSNCLRQVKILDPACGSGAFPMGILNKMIAVFEKLTPNKQESLHDLKLHLIEECIYGIDIQTIAVQISKLRFFISLVVEQEEMQLSKPEQNYGIHTLPNLETKFVAANTLIGIQRKPSQFNLFEDPEIETTKQALLAIRKEHFYAKTVGAKKRLREEDSVLRDKLEKLLEESEAYTPEDALQFSKWNPYDQNNSSPFFDTDWMFGLQEGFDVVIGNPPYIQMQKDGGKLANLFKDQNYKTYQRTGDIYALFYEVGINVLKQGGNINFITSNKWMRAKYGESLRAFFIKYNPKILIDLGAGVFENATVDTNIIILTKENNQNHCLALDLTKVKNITNFEEYKTNWSTLQNLTQDSWAILSGIENTIKQKIEKIGKPLKNWDIQINYGIKTGFNEAFIIDTKTKERICREDPKSEEIIKPILRGKDIKKYQANWAGLWLITTHNGYKEKDKRIPKIEVENYPAIKNHLDQYLIQLTKRGDKGETPYNLRNCAYMGDFEKEKIVYPNMTKYLPFILDEQGVLTNQKCFILTSKLVNIRFILAYLNSSISYLWIRQNCPELQGGTRELSKIFFENIPIPEISEVAQQPFINLVNQILSDKKQGKETTILEHQIDVMVYHLYELSYEEACVIDKELTKEDFEKYKI